MGTGGKDDSCLNQRSNVPEGEQRALKGKRRREELSKENRWISQDGRWRGD